VRKSSLAKLASRSRLVAFEEVTAQRLPGTARGQLGFGPDFDTPLPEDLMAAFET
jgi:hypothetical protein